MRFSVDDTIAAIASARGGGGRGILRISGPRVVECVEQCFAGEPPVRLAEVSRATVLSGRWKVFEGPPRLPGELYWWPGIRSYTRQPTAEFHTLGSPPLLDEALAAACGAGARLARPGEFTLRAFLAGRLDLTQAEAVLGVIDAESPAQFRAALDQLAGGLSAELGQLRHRLLDLLAHVEASLDFATEDIEVIAADTLRDELAEAAQLVATVVQRMATRGQSEGPPRIVLIGLPNRGKSSLFNALCGEAAAIVAPVPGTTRDYVERHVQWNGQSCVLVDTAGIDAGGEATGTDRQAALARAATQAAESQRSQAAIELLCLDSSQPLDPWEWTRLAEPTAVRTTRLVALTKCDQLAARDARDAAGRWLAARDMSGARHECPVLATSSLAGWGLDELRSAIVEALSQGSASAEGLVAATVVRCRDSLRRAAEALDGAQRLVGLGQEELVAAELRMALDDLGEVTGAVYTDDVLDRIFSRFCIGK